jgi:GNAT superfamily N-acetyltransferase
MTVSKAIHKLRRHVRDYGLLHTLGKVALYPLSWLYVSRNYRISRLDVNAAMAPSAGDRSLQYRFITANDREIIAQIETMEEWLEGMIAPKLRAGDLCVVAMDGNTLAGFKLVTFGRYIGIIDWTRTARPNSAWVYFIGVRHDLRGRGIASGLRNLMTAELKRRGVTRLYSGAMTFNVASLRSQGKSGYREIVDVRYRRILWFHWRRYSRIPAKARTVPAG